MSMLDDRLAAATENLQSEIEHLAVPDFAPRRPVGPAVLVMVLLMGFGLFSYLAQTADGPGGLEVATQGEDPAPPATEGEGSLGGDAEQQDAEAEDVESETDTNSGQEGDASVVKVELPRAGLLTAAAAGEFYVPLPMVSAWNADETRVLLYRTGEADPGHVIVDSATGALVAELPISPPDIEQVYWSATDPATIYTTEGADLIAVNIEDLSTTVVHSFSGCDQVGSGVVPVKPSVDDVFGLLCQSGSTTTMVSYDMATDREVRAPTTSDTAPAPSPSGRYFVLWNEDGSATVLDEQLAATGTILELEGNLFDFVIGEDGESVVATLFDGPIIGTLVRLPLDGGDPGEVLIGPDQGDPYPPSGTRLSSNANIVAMSIRADDSAGDDAADLVGGVHRFELGQATTPFERTSIRHGSEDLHGYWSTAFVSLSPSGRYAVYSTDSGGDRVDSIIVDFENPPG